MRSPVSDEISGFRSSGGLDTESTTMDDSIMREGKVLPPESELELAAFQSESNVFLLKENCF